MKVLKNVSLHINSQKRDNPKHRRQKIRQKSLNVSLLIISQKRNNQKHRRQKIRQKSLSLKYMPILFLTVIQITQQQLFLKIPSIRISRQTDF